MTIQLSLLWHSLVAKTEPDPWSWANTLKKKKKKESLECFRLVYPNISTMLRQFWSCNCTCTSGAYAHPRDGPNHEHFFHEHLTWAGKRDSECTWFGIWFSIPALWSTVPLGHWRFPFTWKHLGGSCHMGCPLDWFLQLLRACCICVKAVASDFTVFGILRVKS